MDELINRLLKAPPLYRWGGVAVAVVLITLANFLLFVNPVEGAITGQQVRQRLLDAQLQEKSEIAQNLNERRREMDVLQQKLDEALSELPEEADVDELLAQLNDVGRKSGLEISTVEPTTEQPAQIYVRIPIRMSVTGNYNEVALFLQEVANMRRIVNVNNLRLSTPQVRAEKVVLTADFIATAFRFLDQNAAKAAEKKAGTP
ncbi:MAG TPA: type 4a pilus biogenesis protein PilO [Myxococcaceae bacterium]|jgi:type IV pilus assembly protein PilO|nr:type 4a pilus biogenesis protein PilO [Myxococcaceae bacterium]